ncbi:MAG: GNAT family N-acetyltransferase [Pseudomonadota bacterium]|nr:GNAT family N-acetyltransferase [Pseudomonadota bacterium]
MKMAPEEVKYGTPPYKALLNLRYEVLRKPIGMELREKDTALDYTEHHVGIFDSNRQAIGCVLLRPLNDHVVLLRQMAVLDSYQGKGIGAKLVAHAETLASQKGFTRIETRARKTAYGFYAKLGYTAIDNVFADEHTLTMGKSLTPGATP